MSNLVHIASVPDGAIVHFPHSVCEYMKVSDPYYVHKGVIDLSCGHFIPCGGLTRMGLDPACEIVANSFADYYDKIFYAGMNYNTK